MNRQLKFRAWDKENLGMLTHEEIDQFDKDGVAHWMDIIQHNNKEGFDVMQFIGVSDMSRKDIYEGDIVEVKKNGEDTFTGEVKWNNQSAGFYFISGNRFIEINSCGQSCGENFHQLDNVKVIGNIYENSELLKTK